MSDKFLGYMHIWVLKFKISLILKKKLQLLQPMFDILFYKNNTYNILLNQRIMPGKFQLCKS